MDAAITYYIRLKRSSAFFGTLAGQPAMRTAGTSKNHVDEAIGQAGER
jgi:hypothetical protein